MHLTSVRIFFETFPFDSASPSSIRTETQEFSAVCPFSGLPDIGKVIIEYYPTGGKCIELRSLKYYFISFRSVGIFQEGVTKRIYADLKKSLGTNRLKSNDNLQCQRGIRYNIIEGSL